MRYACDALSEPSSSRFQGDIFVQKGREAVAVATAIKEARSARQVARDSRGVCEWASLEFLVFQDEEGGYHWVIVGGSGESLAQSGSFESYDQAARAGRYARDGAESARFERRAAEDRVVDVRDRREAAGRDLDVGRWLDEGGSFRFEAAAKWLAVR